MQASPATDQQRKAPASGGVAGAVVVADVVAVAVAAATAAAAAAAAAATLGIQWLYTSAPRAMRERLWPASYLVATLSVTYLVWLVGIAMLLPTLPGRGIVLAKGALTSSSTPFISLFFLGLLPLLNAVSDWVSINATRVFIARMQAGASRGEVGRLYFYDVAIALALTLIVYAAALAVIWMMQRFGWQVDVKSVLVELRDNPWSGQSTWLLTLAITNFIPTLAHVALWMFGSVQPRDDETRSHIEQFLRDGGSSALRQIAPTIVSMLRIQPWLERAMVLSLTLALIPLFAICVPAAADWLLQRL